MCVCLCVWVCACECWCLKRPEAADPPGVEVIGSCELPVVGSRSSVRAISTLNQLAYLIIFVFCV